MKSKAKNFGKRAKTPASKKEYISRDVGKPERRDRDRRIIKKPVGVERRRGSRRVKKGRKTPSAAALGRPRADSLMKEVPHYLCDRKYSPSPELRKIMERFAS